MNEQVIFVYFLSLFHVGITAAMKLASLLLLLLLFIGCGKQKVSLPVITNGAIGTQVSEISSEVYRQRLEQLTETYLAQTSLDSYSDYQLEVLTLGLFMDAGAGLGPIKSSAQAHLELHFGVEP